MIKGVEGLMYEEQLHWLVVLSLKKKHLEEGLIAGYKIMSGLRRNRLLTCRVSMHYCR